MYMFVCVCVCVYTQYLFSKAMELLGHFKTSLHFFYSNRQLLPD